MHYDSEAYEVLLGERVDGTPLKAEGFSSTMYSKDPGQTTYNDVNYEEVLYRDRTNASVQLKPDKKYQTLYLKIAALNEDLEDIEISDHNSKALLKKVDRITVEEGLTTIEVDIAGSETLFINFKNKQSGFMIPLIHSYYK